MPMFEQKKTTELSKFQTFLFPIILGWICSIFTLIITNGQAWNGTVIEHGADRFMDFFNHIFYSADIESTYTWTYHACFPPLSYLFYHFISMLLPDNTIYMGVGIATGTYGLLTYISFILISLFLFNYVVGKVCNDFSEEKRLLITIIFSFSYSVFIGCIERGNNIIYVCILLLMAIIFKDSPNKIKRELSLLFIAIAASLKIYPAIFGLIYIYEKRWKEAFRLIIYGILFFFIPFIWLGGFNGFRYFLLNQLVLHSSSVGTDDVIAIYSISIGHFAQLITTNHTTITVMLLLCMLVFLVLAKFQTSSWKRYTLLCACMTLIPLWSGLYTITYFVIPLLFFLKNTTIHKLNAYYSFIFGIIFSLFFLPYQSSFVDWPRFFCLMGSYLLVIIVCFDTIYNIIKQCKK